jgi:hypothetical protein
VLQQKRKAQKSSLNVFNDEQHAASVGDDDIDDNDFYVLFVIVIFIQNRVLGMNAFSAKTTKKWLHENCGPDNLFCADC